MYKTNCRNKEPTKLKIFENKENTTNNIGYYYCIVGCQPNNINTSCPSIGSYEWMWL